MSSLIGLELLYHSATKEIVSKQDSLVVVMHWYMISHGFKCIAASSEINLKDLSEGSELLPPGWNESQDVYNLQYILPPAKKRIVYLLAMVMVDSNILINAYKIHDDVFDRTLFHFPELSILKNSGSEKTTSMSCVVDKYIDKNEKFPKVYKDISSFVLRFGNETVLPLCLSENNSKIKAESKAKSDLTEETGTAPAFPSFSSQSTHREWPEELPFGIGRGDLTPFGGGGMLFDPTGNAGRFPGLGSPAVGIPGRLPPGAVPPGARFDPFGPPDPDRTVPQPPTSSAGPNPDHLQPPGFEDMFS